jgi:hypothetical protein
MTDEIKCSHQGKYRSLGTTVFPIADMIIVIHNIFCKECGETMVKIKQVSLPKPPEPTIQKVSIDPRSLIKGKQPN